MTRGRATNSVRRGMSSSHLQLAYPKPVDESEEPCSSIMKPDSPSRVLWDLLGGIFIVWDMLWLPFSIVFDYHETTFTEVMGWLGRLFFLLDIPFTFLTGYYLNNGILELKPRKVAVKYMKTWFPFDVVLVTVDWAEATIVSTSELHIVGASRLIKILHLVRFVRMLRLARLGESLSGVFKVVYERVVSERLGLMLSILKSVLEIAFFGHLAACIWFQIGSDASPEDGGWANAEEYQELPPFELYLVSLHYALKEMLGTALIEPKGSVELSYAILLLFSGMVINAAFVSSVTTSITRLDIINIEHQKKLSILRRYLNNHGVPSKLAVRLTQNAQTAAKRLRKQVLESDVDLLKLVSNPMLVEMHFEMYAKHLCLHPLLQRYCDCDAPAVRQLCHKGVKTSTYSAGEIVFSRGDIPESPQMFFVTLGTAIWMGPDGRPKSMNPPQWICEMVLWVAQWRYVGTLTCLTDASFITLDAHTFQEVLRKSSFADDEYHPATYAAAFVDRLCETELQLLTDNETLIDHLTHRSQ